jgi:hypothetical protein
MDEHVPRHPSLALKERWWKGFVYTCVGFLNLKRMPDSAYPSPLYQILYQHDIMLVVDFLDQGGDPNELITVEWAHMSPDRKARPLHVACGLEFAWQFYRNPRKIFYFVPKSQLHYNTNGRPSCRLSVVDLLLQRGADVNARYVRQDADDPTNIDTTYTTISSSVYSDLLPERQADHERIIRGSSDNRLLRVLLRLNGAFTDNERYLGSNVTNFADNPRGMPHYAAETAAVQYFREFKHQFHSDEKSWLAIIASATRAWNPMSITYITGMTLLNADLCTLILAYGEFKKPTWYDAATTSDWWYKWLPMMDTMAHNAAEVPRWLSVTATIDPTWWETWRQPTQRELAQARITDYYDLDGQ